jgi:hypothetical protein
MPHDFAGEGQRLQNAFQHIDLTGKVACRVFHQIDDFDEPRFVPAVPVLAWHLAIPDILPFAQILPLDMADGDGRRHRLQGLHQDGIDRMELVECQCDFIPANPRIACGMLAHKGDCQLGVANPLGDSAAPIFPGADFLVIDPDGMAPFFEIVFKAIYQLLVFIVAVAEENLFRVGGFLGKVYPAVADGLWGRKAVFAILALILRDFRLEQRMDGPAKRATGGFRQRTWFGSVVFHGVFPVR